MTIYDYWLNPLDSELPTVTVLGFREDLEEFPHELYSFFLSTVRDMDIKSMRLLYRWMMGMQTEWEAIYGKILNLPLLYSPEFCPEEYLDFLAMNVGISSPDMDYLWGELSTNEKRRLLDIFVQSLVYRGTDLGITRLFRAMTGQYAEIREFFDFRWLISGDGEYNQETALGFEDNPAVAGDPWLLSEHSMPVGMLPDGVSVLDLGSGNYMYGFTINNLVDAIVDPPVPPNPRLVRVTYRPTKQTAVGTIFYSDPDWGVFLVLNEVFGQTAIPYSEAVEDFRVAIENNPYEFDIRIMDDGSVNRGMVRALARFSRPLSERIFIRYFWLLERFTDIDGLDNWTEVSGTVTHDYAAGEVTLSDAAEESAIRTDVSNDDDWYDFSVGARVRMSVADTSFYLKFFWQDADNYMMLEVTPAAVPTIPVGTWTLWEVEAGVPSDIEDGTLDQFDLDVNYFFRVVIFRSEYSVGDLICRIYQDENLLIDTANASAWLDVTGKVEVACEDGGTAIVSDVEVHPYPMDSDYVGP